MAMKTTLDITKTLLLVHILVSGVFVVSASENNLNPTEKKTVTIMKSISNNGNFQTNIQNAKYIEKDTQFMSSHLKENAVAQIGDDQADSVVNTISKQFFRSIFGVYEEEVKTKLLTLDFSDDEVAESNISVSSYDKRNFELTMRSRKNKEKLATEQGSLIGDNKEEKGKWKVRPRVGNPGLHVNYLSSKFDLEMRMTTSEQVVNLRRNLRDISVDVFYNIDLKNQESSLTLTRPVYDRLNLQVQSIGNGVNAFENSEERVSLHFGHIF